MAVFVTNHYHTMDHLYTYVGMYWVCMFLYEMTAYRESFVDIL